MDLTPVKTESREVQPHGGNTSQNTQMLERTTRKEVKTELLFSVMTRPVTVKLTYVK